MPVKTDAKADDRINVVVVDTSNKASSHQDSNKEVRKEHRVAELLDWLEAYRRRLTQGTRKRKTARQPQQKTANNRQRARSYDDYVEYEDNEQEGYYYSVYDDDYDDGFDDYEELDYYKDDDGYYELHVEDKKHKRHQTEVKVKVSDHIEMEEDCREDWARGFECGSRAERADIHVEERERDSPPPPPQPVQGDTDADPQRRVNKESSPPPSSDGPRQEGKRKRKGRRRRRRYRRTRGTDGDRQERERKPGFIGWVDSFRRPQHRDEL